MIGLVQLLPMNFLITADDVSEHIFFVISRQSNRDFFYVEKLWNYKFRDVNSTDTHDKTELQKFFDSYLIIACNSPFLLVYLVSMTQYFHR